MRRMERELDQGDRHRTSDLFDHPTAGWSKAWEER